MKTSKMPHLKMTPWVVEVWVEWKVWEEVWVEWVVCLVWEVETEALVVSVSFLRPSSDFYIPS